MSQKTVYDGGIYQPDFLYEQKEPTLCTNVRYYMNTKCILRCDTHCPTATRSAQVTVYLCRFSIKIHCVYATIGGPSFLNLCTVAN